ncbi:MAG: alpha/beta hydrolase [Myxococcales bacterium]
MRAALAIAAAVIAFGVAALFAGQRALIYPAPKPARTPSSELGELVRLPSTVALWSPPSPGAAVVVHFHGNGEQLADLGRVIAALRAAGFGVLAVEYPGYGLASGKPSQITLLSAAREALAYARDRLGIAPGRIVLQGQSLGSGVASQLAAEGQGAALVLISPFTSMTDLATRLFPALPVQRLVRDRFDTRDVARSVRVPVLIVHGDRDEVVPFSMGEELARIFPDARLMRVEGAHHNDLWHSHGGEMSSAIAAFVGRRRVR